MTAAGCLSIDGSGSDDITLRRSTQGYAYTYPNESRNRVLHEQGNIRDTEPVKIDIERPRWIVPRSDGVGSSWTIVAEDGSATQWRVTDGKAKEQQKYGRVEPDTPPVVGKDEMGSYILNPPKSSSLTSPVVHEDGTDTVLYTDGNGSLLMAKAGTGDTKLDSLEIGTLPDARIARVGGSKYALFGDNTRRYRHGALGDTVEGSSLVIVDVDSKEIVAKNELDPPDVFEELGPIAANFEEKSGTKELVTAVANSSQGARMAVFDDKAERIATGPVHEPGWRHPLAVAPLGPNGETEIAVVRKPHVEKVLEFYRLRSGSLRVVATIDGFQTHTYGSRNLDGAIAADADADGSVEVLLPSADRRSIVAVERTQGGARDSWSKNLESRVTTNLTGVETRDGISVGVGDSSGVYVWQG